MRFGQNFVRALQDDAMSGQDAIIMQIFPVSSARLIMLKPVGGKLTGNKIIFATFKP